MSRKATIATLAAALMALAGAPAGAQAAEQCSPGTPEGPYCVKEEANHSGLTTKQHKATTSEEEGFSFGIKIHCSLEEGCAGVIYLYGKKHKASAARVSRRRAGHSAKHSHKTPVYAVKHYRIKDGRTATLRVHLDPAGRRALTKHRRLKMKAVAVSKGTRTKLGSVVVKATRTHSTHATEPPGFTG